MRKRHISKGFYLNLPLIIIGLEKLFPEDAVESGEVGDREIEKNKFCELVGDILMIQMIWIARWLPPRHDKYHIPRMNDENLKYQNLYLRQFIVYFKLRLEIFVGKFRTQNNVNTHTDLKCSGRGKKTYTIRNG